MLNINDKSEMSFSSDIDIHYVVIIGNKKYASYNLLILGKAYADQRMWVLKVFNYTKNIFCTQMYFTKNYYWSKLLLAGNNYV